MSASPPTSTTGFVHCSSCGVGVADPTLSGMVEQDARRGPTWVCGDCLRRNVRAVEAKLDRDWW